MYQILRCYFVNHFLVQKCFYNLLYLNVEKLSEQYTREALEGRGRRVIYVVYGTTSCLEQMSKFGKIQRGQPKSEQEVGRVSTGPRKKARRNCSKSNYDHMHVYDVTGTNRST